MLSCNSLLKNVLPLTNPHFTCFGENFKEFSTNVNNTNNYAILQKLGLDPTFVHIHKNVIENNKSVIKG